MKIPNPLVIASSDQLVRIGKERLSQQFEQCADIIADLLLLFEVNYVTNIQNPENISKVQEVLDNYALEADSLIDYYKNAMTEDVEKLFSKLMADLEKKEVS